jgi:replicative DNA helicase
MNILNDPSAERGVLAGLASHGKDAYLDIADIVSENSFITDNNAIIFKCFKHVFEEGDSAKADIPSLLSASQSLNLINFLTGTEAKKYLQSLFMLPITIENTRKLAGKIRKLEVAKLLTNQLEEAKQTIYGITGNESISEIIAMAEGPIFNFGSLLNHTGNNPIRLGEGIFEYIQSLIDNPIDQVGISTRFPAYDSAIGGGLRRGTVNVIGARPGVGKTTIAMNMGMNIAQQGIKVLNLDTEMIKEDQIHRTLACLSEVSINQVETGKFGNDKVLTSQVMKGGKIFEKAPYFYNSINGMSFEEQLAVMRRWVVKEVGLNEKGKANPCCVVYDYLKLMDSEGMGKDLTEWQLLGFMITALHNFTVRYELPMLLFIQLNRDGITKESTDAASGSDRIVWLCSNFSILKEKSDEELAEDGTENGNRKIVVLKHRHGAGLQHKDYINCKMIGHYAKLVEGQTKFELKFGKNKKVEFDLDDTDGEVEF